VTPVAPALGARTGAATNIAATSATLVGDTTSDGQPSSYHFDYGTAADYGQTTSIAVTNESGQVTADVNDLAPGTEYHFRIVVADAAGQWIAGDDMTFTTAVA
jgi:hypothetical protein